MSKLVRAIADNMTVLETHRLEKLNHTDARLGSLAGVLTLETLGVDIDLLLASQDIFTDLFYLIQPRLKSLQLIGVHWKHLYQFQSYNIRQVMKDIARETSLTDIELRFELIRPNEDPI